MPYCYNIQNTDKRYLFSLFLDKNKNVRKIDIKEDKIRIHKRACDILYVYLT